MNTNICASKKTEVLVSEECPKCLGYQTIKTPTNEDVKCLLCKGVGKLLTPATIIKKDPHWEDLVFVHIPDKNLSKWIFSNQINYLNDLMSI